jgi:nickel-dependent lactate racemase
MIESQAVASNNGLLTDAEIRRVLQTALEGRHRNRKLLVLIPDHTRTLPLPFLFRTLAEILGDAARLDFLVALGTHPQLDENRLCDLVGITPAERADTFRRIGIYNHAWTDPAELVSLGILPDGRIRELAGKNWHPSLAGDLDVRVNRRLPEYDRIIIAGPTFPHEVVGFSGGLKYIVPGTSGPEAIDRTHWLGALAGIPATIGIKNTPVRAMIDAAAEMLTVPVTLIAMVARHAGLSGVFAGDPKPAWNAAADLSSRVHIRWCAKPFRKVLSCPMPMYDELWTAAKAMYKVEPVVAPGGEVVIYAPALGTVSRTHGENIYRAGYHTLAYILANWDRYREFPLAVLAHSTHVRGSGRMENGVERPNVRVILASRIPPADCRRLNLGYLDPDTIRPEDWRDREAEGVLCVPDAGETLFRLAPGAIPAAGAG